MNLQEFFERLNEGRTSFNGGEYSHSHSYKIDEKGDGETIGTIGKVLKHTHKIKNYKVEPSGKDNHTHTLPREKK